MSSCRRWRQEQVLEVTEQIGEQLSIVDTLRACLRFRLSDQERETCGQEIAATYDTLGFLITQWDRYRDSGSEVQEEWIQASKYGGPAS